MVLDLNLFLNNLEKMQGELASATLLKSIFLLHYFL